MEKIENREDGMSSGGLAIFAKTVGLSRVKTRLGAATGTLFAEEFYTLSTEAVTELAALLQAETAITPHWAVAEAAGVRQKSRGSFVSIWTGEGGLGKRLHSIYSRLLKEYGYVMIIGTDSPQITVGLLRSAAELLVKNPGCAVIGPTFDGGFYLFAAKISIDESVWRAVTYSKESTLEELTAELKRHGIGVVLTSALCDVDTVEDLPLLLKAFETQGNLRPEQTRLYAWLKRHEAVFRPAAAKE